MHLSIINDALQEKSMPYPSGSRMAHLQFLTISHPSQAKGSGVRKRIRSHVTRLQHRKAGIGQFSKADGLGVEGSPASDESLDSPSMRPTTWKAPSPVLGDAIDARDHFSLDYPSEATLHCDTATPTIPRELNPFTTYDASSDWKVDIPALIEQYLDRARVYISQEGQMPEIARSLDSRLVQPRLYLDGFLFNALFTLTTTSVPASNERRPHQAMTIWLRSNFLLAIQTLISTPESCDSRALAIGIALLIGWELEVGDPSACQLHLTALPSIIDSNPHAERQNHSLVYRDQDDRVFRGGRHLPSGFEFYRSQNLLPPSLMFYVGSLVYWDPLAPGSSRWMRELWCSIGACAPGPVAQKAIVQGTLDARVSQLVRQAGIMLGSLMRSTAGVRPIAQPLLSGIQAQWYSMLSSDWEWLVGTVFDPILLWSICVFCTTSGYYDKDQVKAISRLCVRLSIRSVDELSALLSTFVWPPCVEKALRELWSRTSASRHMEAR